MAVDGQVLIKKEISADYEYTIKQARTVEDYYDAILIDPERTEAYLQLNDLLMEDGVLSKDESQNLLKLRAGLESKDENGFIHNNDVLSIMKKRAKDNYNEVCYNFGYSFLNYEGAADNELYQNAAVWFQEIDSEDEYLDAKIYCDIADCLKYISQHYNAKIKQTDKIFKDYQELLTKLQSLATASSSYSDLDQKKQAWSIINTIIDDNIGRISELSMDKKSFNDILEAIKSDVVEAADDENTNSAVKKELIDLLESINNTEKRMDTVKTREE